MWWQLWIIVPIFVVMVWQCCNVSVGAHVLGEGAQFLYGNARMKYEWRNARISDIDPLLGLHMIIVALRSGASIPRALTAVGEVLPGGCGLWLCAVSDALLAGDTWHEAWSPVYVHTTQIDSVGKSGMKLVEGEQIASSSILAKWLMSALCESWCYGSSPVPVLLALSSHYERTMANAARQETSRLSVRLLLPVGLCFLPSFICIGIVPTVMSLMR